MRESLQAIRARRKLRLAIVGFAVLLTFPIGLLLIRVYSQLRMETFLSYRATAEELTAQINEKLNAIISEEEKRPFDEYSFYSVASNSLIRNQWVGVSPLSQYPVQSKVPGIVGYFELPPEGRLTTPLLPADQAWDDGAGGLQDSNSSVAGGVTPGDAVARRSVLRKIESILQSSQGLPEEFRSDKEVDRLKSNAVVPSLGQKLDQLKLDERYYRGDAGAQVQSSRKVWDRFEPQSKIAEEVSGLFKQGSGRKEQLNVVTQSGPAISSPMMAAPLDAGNAAEISNEASAGASVDPNQGKKKEVAATGDAAARERVPTRLRQSEFQVSVVEGEIDPFQVALLQDGHIAFFRKVWRNKQRYIQGFVVQANPFLRQLIEQPLLARPLGATITMILSYQGQVLRVFGASPAQKIVEAQSSGSGFGSYSYGSGSAPTSGRDVLIYRGSVTAPLNALELVYTSPGLPWGARSQIVDVLLLSLATILALGFFLLYRLGVAQIALAEQQSNFVSAVSHELKTPLTSIRMYGEMLRSGVVADEAKRRSYYDYIFHESERLSRLIANVLQMARLSRGGMELTLVPMSVGTLLDLVRSKISTVVEAAGFALVIEASDDIKQVQLQLDEDAIVRAFINLVDNALKFSKAATRKEIHVGVRRGSGSTVEFYVRDFGPGVDLNQRRKLFQLFYRGESELTRATPGTGIGLALVRELVARMQGTIDVSNHNPGAEFRLKFPVEKHC